MSPLEARSAGSRFERRDASTLIFPGGGVPVSVTILTSRIVRVSCRLADQPDEPSHVAERSWAPVPFDVLEGEPVRVVTADFQAAVATAPPRPPRSAGVAPPMRISFLDPRGEWLLREPDEAGMSIEPAGGEPAHRRLRANFAFSGEQHFYGLGQGGGGLDRLGATRQLWNTHIGHGPGSDMGVPLLVSSAGYALFFDNPGAAAIAVGRSDGGVRIAYTAETGNLTWYFLFGGDVRGVMREVAELLGCAPLPPRWALGFLQSTRHFRDTAELRELPRALRDKRIPCDGIIYLSTYGEALGWNRGVGHLEFQPELWPDPRGLLDEVRSQHFEVIVHEYPVLHEASTLFAEAESRGYLLAEGYERAAATGANYRQGQRYIDFSSPAARAWWWSAHRALAALGVAGWWLDGGEGPPEHSALDGGDGRLLHNVYDRFRHEAFAEGEAADRPDRRVFLLCRSGAAGMQRFGATCWSGDINNDFATLEAQIPLGLNTGMSGIPYWGTDVGGFFHPIPETGELYARWFQLGAFSPIFRSHGWVWREHVPWAHGSRVEAICRQYAELRYRMLPYTYTLAWQAHTRGLPLMRPLVMNYPDDPRVWALGHQFLWGDDLLVAPVTREGATAWPVYLPEGAWYDFWTGSRRDGPGGITVEAPLERLPLFVRAGAILPMGPVVQHTGERPLDEVTLLIYPADGARFELYEDDGLSNAYRRGQYALTAFECATDPGGLTVRIGEPVGEPSVVPAGRRYRLELRADLPRTVTVAGHGELSRLTGPDQGIPGFWLDTRGFIGVRLPEPLAAPATVILRT
jgi:alpha-glucosidase (family GH31 glycosyl hydrolase)